MNRIHHPVDSTSPQLRGTVRKRTRSGERFSLFRWSLTASHRSRLPKGQHWNLPIDDHLLQDIGMTRMDVDLEG